MKQLKHHIKHYFKGTYVQRWSYTLVLFYTVLYLTVHCKGWSHDSLTPSLIFHLHFSFTLSLSLLSSSSTGSPPPSWLDICCLATPAPIRASGLSSPLQWNQPCMQMADIKSSHTTIKLYRTTCRQAQVTDSIGAYTLKKR